ncbi:TonB-dependent receptor [Candidatus Marinimicrobia bacterium]|nr:TonB-dependent receptor [Candidatus Neomarinimicrobiota bacterium]
MKKFYLLFLLLGISFAQDFKFLGTILDIETKEPIIDANIVFIENDFGAASDINGNFSITNLNKQKYEILVSAIGYRDIKTTINLASQDNFIFELIPEAVLTSALNVVGRFPSKHIPYFTQNISSEKISDNNYQTMSELFRNIGGIDVQTAHDNGRNANFSIRGSSDYKPGGYNNRVLVLLDGFQISMPYSGSIDWNAMPLDFLDRVEVVKGPVSSLYGQNSMGGIINLVTKNYSDEFYNMKATVGSYDLKDLNLTMSNVTDNISYTALLQHKKGNGHRFNAQYEQNNFYTKIFNKKQDLSVSLIANKSINGQPGFFVEDRPSLTSYRISNRNSVYLQLFKKQTLDSNNNIVYSLSMNHFYTNYFDREDTPVEEIQEQTYYNDTSLNLRAEYQKLISTKSYIIFGSDIILEQSDISIYRNIYDNLKQITGGFFVQNRIQLSERFLLGLGLRFDYRNVDRGDDFSYKSFSDVSPKINLTFKRDTFSTWNFALSKGFRSPSFSELFLQYESDYGLNTQGNPNLEPEQLYGLDISFDRTNKTNLTYSVSTFYYNYKDMIDFVYGLPVIALNRSDISSNGLETNISYKINPNLDLDLGYTYLRVDDINNVDPILYRPKHKFISSIKHKSKNISNIISMRYQSKQDYQDFLSDDREYEGSEIKFPIEQLDSLILFNYIGTYELNNNDKMSLKISNLFDKQYELIQDFPMPGRTINLMYESTF